MAAIAVPAGFRNDGLPFGITLIAPAGCDPGLLQLGAKFHHAAKLPLGTSDVPAPAGGTHELTGYIPVAVCGAHMSGLPLNHQLTTRDGFLLQASRTAAKYRFFALPGGPP